MYSVEMALGKVRSFLPQNTQTYLRKDYHSDLKNLWGQFVDLHSCGTQDYDGEKKYFFFGIAFNQCTCYLCTFGFLRKSSNN